jgi:kumamolisin
MASSDAGREGRRLARGGLVAKRSSILKLEGVVMPEYPIAGSQRRPMAGAQATGPADPKETVDVTVLLRRRAAADFERMASDAGATPGTHLSRDEFSKRFGADPKDIAKVKAFATQYGLSVIEESAARRMVRLSGTVAQLQSAFSVELKTFASEQGSYRGRTGAVHVPDELKDVVEAVLGLDNRPQAAAHFRVRGPARVVVARDQAVSATFDPTQLASLYDFPNGPATSQCIALIELGGGFEQADIAAYFSGLKLAVPTVVAVPVDSGSNAPTGDPNGPDVEVMLDIEVAGAVATGARIAVYFAPNTDAGFLDAVTAATHDATNKPSVISISWGSSESNWTQQAMTAFDSAFKAATLLGITVTVASGDNGSSDAVADGANHVDFPASSSFALACGGTTLRASDDAISSESVWNDTAQDEGATGGGVSTVFPLPSWQQKLSATLAQGQKAALTKRGVPDVSGDADPETGYNVRVDGNDMVVGGTSAVAPLWAGLIALINGDSASSVGFLNATLYGNPAACRDVTTGNNGAYYASPGWDACTGLGSPIGKQIAALFSQKPGTSL